MHLINAFRTWQVTPSMVKYFPVTVPAVDLVFVREAVDPTCFVGPV
jgi:hypothetical protein